jgi:hypothetical protein
VNRDDWCQPDSSDETAKGICKEMVEAHQALASATMRMTLATGNYLKKIGDGAEFIVKKDALIYMVSYRGVEALGFGPILELD